MTKRQDCPEVPGPLEEYAKEYDEIMGSLAQRRGFREYMQGLLLPRQRNKTLTAIVGAEPIVGAQDSDVQQMQFFLSESKWEIEEINQRRLDLLQKKEQSRSHQGGVLIIDDTGDRKWGNETAHVSRQYLGSIGKVDQGIVAVSSLWADENIYYPLHVYPYTPSERLTMGKKDELFHTKPEIALALIDAALDSGIEFRAIVSDTFYGEHREFRKNLLESHLPYIMRIKPTRAIRAPEEEDHTVFEFAKHLQWSGSLQPGNWQLVIRKFKDGSEQYWWASEFNFGSMGPDKERRLIVATTDPATLPELTTWYLETNIPRPGSEIAEQSLLEGGDLEEIVSLYGLRTWVEQSYKQVKQELGWADFMVRSDEAIKRHWYLIYCAFSFCWHVWFNNESKIKPQDVDYNPIANGTNSITEQASKPMVDGKKINLLDQNQNQAKEKPNLQILSWPISLRKVRSWLLPWTFLWRWWKAWSNLPPPQPLLQLLDALANGFELNLYLRI